MSRCKLFESCHECDASPRQTRTCGVGITRLVIYLYVLTRFENFNVFVLGDESVIGDELTSLFLNVNVVYFTEHNHHDYLSILYCYCTQE